ncbi:matrixin family metalloprotease [bacterium]|nr:matrixin family metalloprotease [bacterium]
MKKRYIFSIGILAVLLFFIVVGAIALPEYFFNTGVSYFKQGKYFQAYKNLKNARLWNKQNSNYKYYYVQTLAKFKPSYNIQKEMFEFANSDKKDSAQLFAGIQVSLWRNNLLQKYGANYIDRTPMNTEIIHWNPKTFPLKVYVSSEDNSYYPDYYTTEVSRAFGQWTASSGFITFKFIDNESSAQIVVKYEPSPITNCADSGCKYVVAHTDPVIRNGLLKKMVITVYDKDANGSFFSDKELYSTVLHEIGHALGIMGHSYSTDDLMYMANQANQGENRLFIKHRSAFQYISPTDISTIRLLYNIVPTISNTPISEFPTKTLIYGPVVLGSAKNMSSQKLKEAKNYVAQAPDLPGGYIDMAIAYDDMGDFKNALASFQKAYNLSKEDSDKYIILYNISAMYLNNNKPEAALGYAKQAQSLDDNEDVQDLLSNIEHAMNTKTKPFWTGSKKE